LNVVSANIFIPHPSAPRRGRCPPDASGLFCVTFTSGATGQPKAVAVGPVHDPTGSVDPLLKNGPPDFLYLSPRSCPLTTWGLTIFFGQDPLITAHLNRPEGGDDAVSGQPPEVAHPAPGPPGREPRQPRQQPRGRRPANGVDPDAVVLVLPLISHQPGGGNPTLY